MTFSVDDYERAIARIFDRNNNVIGTGFLVAPGYVLTCAHVVLQAIGIEKDKFADYQGQPQEYISLDFHVLASGQEIKAQVVDWLPYSLHTGDVAVLKLLTPEPIKVKPIPLNILFMVSARVPRGDALMLIAPNLTLLAVDSNYVNLTIQMTRPLNPVLVVRRCGMRSTNMLLGWWQQLRKRKK
jgi:Trypsin-like peptidase domain